MQEDQELYQYGYKLLALQAANIVVVIIIGLVFSCLKEMLLFLIAYVPLRSYAGGYHAGGPIRCGIISAAMELAVALAVQIPMAGGASTLMLTGAALCEIIIYVTVPVAAENKPLTESQVVSFRKRARMILGVEIAAMAAMYYAGLRELLTVMALSHIFVAALLIAGTVKKSE